MPSLFLVAGVVSGFLRQSKLRHESLGLSLKESRDEDCHESEKEACATGADCTKKSFTCSACPDGKKGDQCGDEHCLASEKAACATGANCTKNGADSFTCSACPDGKKGDQCGVQIQEGGADKTASALALEAKETDTVGIQIQEGGADEIVWENGYCDSDNGIERHLIKDQPVSKKARCLQNCTAAKGVVIGCEFRPAKNDEGSDPFGFCRYITGNNTNFRAEASGGLNDEFREVQFQCAELPPECEKNKPLGSNCMCGIAKCDHDSIGCDKENNACLSPQIQEVVAGEGKESEGLITT